MQTNMVSGTVIAYMFFWQLERAFAIQLFLQENPVFTECTPFEFVPAAGDKVKPRFYSKFVEVFIQSFYF